MLYDKRSAEWPDQLTASAFNQHTGIPDNKACCHGELAVSSLALAITIATPVLAKL